MRALILIDQTPDGRLTISAATDREVKPDTPVSFALIEALAFLQEHLEAEVLAPEEVISTREASAAPRMENASDNLPQGCNLHRDCAAANRTAEMQGKPYPAHCHDECCTECFGH